MPEIPHKYRFMPNETAQQQWFATRKSPRTFGTQTLPGLFQTVGYGADIAWVVFALCVELCAVVLTVWGGYLKGGNFLVIAIVVVVLFVVFDFVGAIFHHRPVGKRCLIRNHIQYESDPVEIGSLQKKLKSAYKTYRVFGVALIILSGLLKIGAMLVLGYLDTIFYLIMGALYLLVIYIHLNHTGYFLAEWRVSRLFKKQYREWEDCKTKKLGQQANIECPHDAKIKTEVFTTSIKLRDTEKIYYDSPDSLPEQNGHRIVFLKEEVDKKGDKIYFYEFVVHGLLIDNDIEELINGQGPEQAGAIALACLKHQLSNHALEKDA